ncbi:hypothetical protein LG634_34000 [Streptomyces bambusae]|uniref:hypothetical protein n=1 Tax=Streptomyces bambusae TaxID=1550616 RepID=UPI001CFFDB0F|nr:hypothetical protein [Streptomyces bambusae]MCB5169802.1 hypothetical protein [Streptomyces bambusae]
MLYRATAPEPAPEVAYRSGDAVCDRFKAAALTRLLGKTVSQGGGVRQETAVLDRTTCARDAEGGTETEEHPDYTRRHWVMLDLTLHKKVDPETEFEATARFGDWWTTAAPEPEAVPGLGEHALMTKDEGGGTWKLRVLDGGAVFTLSVMVLQDYNGMDVEDGGPRPDEPRTDSAAVQAAMIQDMRALMTTVALEK